MQKLKTPEEIIVLKQGGAILSQALRAAIKACRPGVMTDELDGIARSTLELAGAKPSFLGYQLSPKDPPFPSTTCISINDEVVHGPAYPARSIKDGDLVSIDIGCWYKGLATDMATTVMVGNVSSSARDLVNRTRESLVRSLEVVKDGAFVSDIGGVIEDYLKPFGYGIVRDLVGHGVGHSMHEDPQIPHYREKRAPTIKLQAGMVIAIEPMVNMGDWRVAMKSDGWTITSLDKSLAAHFEVTIAVTKGGFELITPWPDC